MINILHPKYCVQIRTVSGDLIATFRSKKRMAQAVAAIKESTEADIAIFQHDKKGTYNCITPFPENDTYIVGFR